ncbi:MAG: hypothetical protein KAJ95_01830 [Gammaproteobacteria bacterium]|nr:hypothetical protein [Gammaproteobacteria bacterium]
MSEPNKSEADKSYRLVFTGALLPGFSKQIVVTQLQQALHLDKEKAELLLEGKHRQIDKKLSLERAEKLRAYVLEQGAECILLPIDEAFIDTEQLPVFVRGNDESISKPDAVGMDADISESPAYNTVETQQSVDSVNTNSSPAQTDSKFKYLISAALLVTVAGIVLWKFLPVSETKESAIAQQQQRLKESNEQEFTATLGPATKEFSTAEELETDEMLQKLSVRTGLWFADQKGKLNPTEINWIWIQGDLGISVREMNDSWGKTIKFIGNSDGFELRSSGSDRIFFTNDDLFRETSLQ